MCAWGCVYFHADECAHTPSYCSPIHVDALEGKSRAGLHAYSLFQI